MRASQTQARCLLEQSLALSGELNDLYSECQRLASLAQLEMDETRFAQALAWQERRVANYRLLGSRPRLAHALHDLAIVACWLGDCARGPDVRREPGAVPGSGSRLGGRRCEVEPRVTCRSRVARLRGGGHVRGEPRRAPQPGQRIGHRYGLAGLGGIALRRRGQLRRRACSGWPRRCSNDCKQARSSRDSVSWSVPAFQFHGMSSHARELRTFGRMAFEAIGANAFASALAAGRALSTGGAVALGLEYAERVANGAGGSTALGQVDGFQSLQASRTALHDDTAVSAWRTSQATPLDQAVAFGLAPGLLTPPSTTSSAEQRPVPAPGSLTRREREVAVLVAEGRSNGEIGAALVIAARTADTHVGHILSKLGLHTRAQIAAWVVEHGLANREPVSPGTKA